MSRFKDAYYGVSYRELAEMMEERSMKASPTTLYCWVQKYAPEIEKRWKPGWSTSWQVDETYVKVNGQWTCLYRAITKQVYESSKAYPPAIKALKKDGLCAKRLKQRQVKYLNNRIESDYGKLKRLISPVRGPLAEVRLIESEFTF